LRDIGLFLGGRDHSTIVHAYSKIEQAMIGDQCFAQKMQMLEKEIVR
jgi:chromosomal replication initiation ATPase DnaA